VDLGFLDWFYREGLVGPENGEQALWIHIVP
jgi:hypothetical protein